MRNFKFITFAVIALLLLSFAFSPPDASASVVPSAGKQSVKFAPGQTAIKVFGSTENPPQSVLNSRRNLINPPVNVLTKYGQSVTGLRDSYLTAAITSNRASRFKPNIVFLR